VEREPRDSVLRGALCGSGVAGAEGPNRGLTGRGLRIGRARLLSTTSLTDTHPLLVHRGRSLVPIRHTAL
jgi:hypothetical protein